MEGNRLERFTSAPCPRYEITRENIGQIIRFRNYLQVILATRKFGETAYHSAESERLEKYSKDFKDAFERTLFGDKTTKGDPLFFARYSTIRDIPESELKKIEDKIAENE